MKIDFVLFSKIALRNIFRHWKRSLAAILSIAAGFASINLFEGYIADVKNIFEQTYSKRLMYGQLLVQRTESLTSGIGYDSHLMSLDDQNELISILSKSALVDNYVRFLHITGLASSGGVTTVFQGLGYDLERGLKMRQPNWAWNTLAGLPLDQGDGNPRYAVIGHGFGRIVHCLPEGADKALDFKNGYSRDPRNIRCQSPELELNVTSQNGQMNASSLLVHGMVDAVYRELDLRFVSLSLQKAQELLATNEVSLFSVRAKNPRETDRLLQDLNSEFRARNLDLTAVRWQEHPFGELYVQSVDFLNVFRNFTLFVTLAIISLSVFSLLTRLVQERTREIATLRCLGFHAKQIRILFLTEGFFLSIFGILLGLSITLALAPLLNSLKMVYKIGILSEKIPFQIGLVPLNFLIAGVGLSSIAMIAASIAIERSLKKTIPDALIQ